MALRLAGACACGCLAASAGCKGPVVGAPVVAAPAGGPELRLTAARVEGVQVIASLEVKDHGAPVATAAEARALAPSFTLAVLAPHPADRLPAWKSLLLTGSQTTPSLPLGGPGTPALSGVPQPGAESGGRIDGADGAFTYRFLTALPSDVGATQTLRVGVWLEGAGTEGGTSTHDFRPDGGSPAPRDTVRDENCRRCHARVVSPRGAVGVRICTTCHTWQNADPDTVDPAALSGSTPATDPNPLELGRMVHLIHRGKWIPTVYASSSSAPAPALPSAAALPLPFSTSRTSGATAANPPVLGRKWSIVGHLGRERIFAQVVARTDNFQPAKIAVAGPVYPRDLRDCGACHAGAPQESETVYAISRRTCHGCHPDVWFAPPRADGTTSIAEAAPAVHFAHSGGPMTDDARCGGCHVTPTATDPKLYAPIAEAHVVPRDHPRASRPRLELVSVSNLVPGGAPTVSFKLADRVGVLSPPNAPVPAADTATQPSPVPRAMTSLRIALAGSTRPDYVGAPIASSDAGNPSALTLVADAQGVFTYTFVSTLPETAKGTWAVVVEGRRRGATRHYDPATDAFGWPYTGETVTESPDNVVAYVDTAAGTWPAGGAPVPRRRIVSQQKCVACHARFESHGGNRHEIESCVTCHTADRTDWSGRPKWAAGTPLAGNVNLGATFDGIEERSVQLKVMIHRIHTGGREGSAALDLVRPYSGSGTSAAYKEGLFPGDLARCTVCHEGRSYLVSSVPADALPTVANESGTILHEASLAHGALEPAAAPIRAACLGCHATGSSLGHAARYTLAGVEQCAQCHVRGPASIDAAHGLLSPGATAVDATYSEIAEHVLAPRCAGAACHGGGPGAVAPRLDAAAAYAQTVRVASREAPGLDLVKPGEPSSSYLVLKLRGEGASVGGVATSMPSGHPALDPSDVAAIEAWIANGAPND